MRGLGAIGLAGVAGCTMPNPAWLVTESSEAGSATGSSATGEATAEATGTTEVTSVGGTTTEGTEATGTVTTMEPVTSGPVTTTTTTGPDTTTGEPGTTGGDACVFPDAPEIALKYTGEKPIVCDDKKPRIVLAEVLGQVAENQWKFNVCADQMACVQDNATCGAGEHVIFTFEGPEKLRPTFVAGECHEIHMLPRGPIANDAKSCALRLLRFGHTRFQPYATHYVGAVAAPGTDGLPGNLDWSKVLGFKVSGKSAKACMDAMNCFPAAGTWEYLVVWDNQNEHTVAEGESFVEHFTVMDDGQNVAIKGTFTDVRSRIALGECPDNARQDFQWAWLAALPP